MKVFDHITLNYTDYKKYYNFYLEVLHIFKYKILGGQENLYVGFGKDKATFWISQADVTHLETKNLHIAFVADTFEQVDKFYNIAIKHGLKDNSKSGFRSEYHENYYACFLLDEQNNNIECVFRDKTNTEEFELWSKEKSKLDKNDGSVFFTERDVYWCGIGKNIGDEEDGKGNRFARPVLIFRKFNDHLFWGLPFSTKNKDNPYYLQINFQKQVQSAMISHLRLYDGKRLNSRMGKLSEDEFKKIIEAVQKVANGEKLNSTLSGGGATNVDL